MKKLFFGMAFAMLTVSCIAQTTIIRGSGKIARGAFDIPLDYVELSVRQGIKVVLVSSETGEGTISADEEIFKYVSIEEHDGRVEVRYSRALSIRNIRVETIVRMPMSKARMRRLDVSSAGKIESEQVLVCDYVVVNGSSSGDMRVDIKAQRMQLDLSSAADYLGNIEADEVEANLSSSADFRGHVSAGKLDVDMSSAAKFEVEGNVNECEVEASSAAGFRGFGLVSKRADIDVSSGASAEITVTEEIDADASSGAAVRYKGSPSRVDRDASSGGSVRNVD